MLEYLYGKGLAGTKWSETSAYTIQTPENYTEENIQHSEHSENLKSRRLQICLIKPRLVPVRKYMSGRPTFLVRNDWKPGTLHCPYFAVREIQENRKG